MTDKHKRMLLRILGCGILLTLGLTLPVQGDGKLFFFLPAYLLIGWDILFKAFRNICRGKVFDENFLMSAASVGAFFIREYPEAVAVMLFYQVGELFQSYAVGKSRASIARLMDIRPDYANVSRDGILVRTDPDEVEIGEEIVVTPGERIPLDGVVLSGSGSLDASALTGESIPRTCEEGDEVISGCINLSGVLSIRVTKPYGDSTVAKILDLVENAASQKARTERFITRFARVYTPAVVIFALLLAVIPPLFVSGFPIGEWIYRALSFLVVSCPCALVISVPLSFFGGIGGASRNGILVKGSHYMEALAKTETAVFDKTGTLTKGEFTVSRIQPVGISERDLLETAALAESRSNHPISLSLRKAYGRDIDGGRIGQMEELAGYGMRADIEGKQVLAGNERLLEKEGIVIPVSGIAGTVVHVAIQGEYKGYISISDVVKPDAKSAVEGLKNLGVKTVMLTGDSGEAGGEVARQLGLDEVYSQLLPADKVREVERLLSEKSKRGSLAFIGDGINDAPVLARADIGVAMGALGSDAAIEAADIVLMDDHPSKILTAISIAKKTLRIAGQNIWFALSVKAVVLLLSATGNASLWVAVFADVGVSVIAILNAMRALFPGGDSVREE